MQNAFIVDEAEKNVWNGWGQTAKRSHEVTQLNKESKKVILVTKPTRKCDAVENS